MKKKNISIILPVRIGDSIMSIPMLLCLKQLNEKYQSNLGIKVITRPFLHRLFSELNLFNCKSMSMFEKAKSILNTPHKAFFLETTNKNLGYTSKKSYGNDNPCKKLLKFSQQLPYLNFREVENHLPKELISFLQNKYGLCFYSISHFGICLDLGFSVEQIINTFQLYPEIIDLKNFQKPLIKGLYIVGCMEAGYGRKDNEHRFWEKENHYETARKCYEDYRIKTVFIGVDTSFRLPNREYIIDFRKKLNLYEAACLIKSSLGYIGNDTGPLHIANLMQKPSISLYFKENLLAGYPFFPKLNIQVYKPQNIDELYDKVKHILY